MGWSLLRQLYARGCSRNVRHFADLSGKHGVQWTVTWLCYRISLFLLGNWAPGLQTQVKKGENSLSEDIGISSGGERHWTGTSHVLIGRGLFL